MIVLHQNTANDVVFTLTEMVTLSGSPQFLFVFECDEERGKPYKCIAQDISSSTERYNEFILSATTDPSNPNILLGEVYLPRRATYLYKVYAQSSSTNLNPTLSTSLVETGKALVLYQPIIDDRYTLTGSSQYDTVIS